MKLSTAILLMALSMIAATAQPVKDRIVHNDLSKYRTLTAVHAGAGQMAFTQLIGRNELATNFLYLHAGVINAKSGIGHHFHHTIEEMYVLLNGEAEFTITVDAYRRLFKKVDELVAEAPALPGAAALRRYKERRAVPEYPARGTWCPYGFAI